MVCRSLPCVVTLFVSVSVLADQCPPTACGDTESCCQDSSGWECCVKQSTFCVAPRGPFQTSTCCGRWTVACTVGSVGCCDPARPWQFFGDTSANQTSRRRPTQLPNAEAYPFTSVESAGGAVGYALFAGGAFYDGLSVLTVELSSGSVTASNKVTGPAASYYKNFFGESWRIVPWDAAGSRFVFADQDYKSMGPNGKITVYTIDAATGKSTSADVSMKACYGYPLGMAWDAKASKLVLGIHEGAQAKYCGVDPSTGAAADLGSIRRGSSESSQDFYAGYFLHADDSRVLRVGHKQVTTGSGPVAIHTELKAGAQAKSTAWAAPLADSHALPVTTQLSPKGGYISLAPKSSGGSLDVVSWDGPSGKSQVLAPLSNANIPSSLGLKFGYVADAVAGNTYAAITVKYGGLLGAGDKWTVAVVDLTSGSVTQQPLNPQPSVLGAETIALSGFGLPSTQEDVIV